MSVFHDEVELEDFDYDEESETYSYPCPCGDIFTITKVGAMMASYFVVCVLTHPDRAP